ncbi:uncharacterized protein LOC133029176 [Cannabis sativa]|uniref:uncharacterized protein LOC133029176 n=1 Tax=Cannabis sativa TaxID=3483 RepID=UPI0029CA3F94|nr:uncharacterized protein LOC133029176 [Cannabis sativa]
MASSSRVMEELENRWDTICLEEEEESEEILEDEEDGNPVFDGRWSLVGKLLTGRISDYKVFQNMIADLWKPGKGMTVKILEQNRFLFQFYHEIDIQRVINGSPWTFDRKHLILKRLKAGDNPKMVELDTIDMWVQIHDLQSGFKTEQAVQKAGNYIGTFLSSDPNNFHGIWRDYLRVRVSISLHKPLKRRMKFRKRDGETFWANFKYEKVPTFCFICGIMGHPETFCPKLYDTPVANLTKPYGLFMKAPPRRNNFLTASPWLRQHEAPPMDTGVKSPDEDTEFNAPHDTRPDDREDNLPRNNYGNLHGYGKEIAYDLGAAHVQPNMALNEPIVLVKENQALFSSDMELTISELKRRRPPNIMSTLSWNCRGLGNPRAIQFLEDICFQKKPKFLFLCETLCNKELVNRVRVRLGFEGAFSVDAVGRKGGLALFWKSNDEAKFLGFSQHHIDLEVSVQGMGVWRLTGLYGEPNRQLRHQTWQLLRSLSLESTLPWCVIGDFNNIASNEEKKGGRPYPTALISGFQSALDDCHLIDLELRGYPFTWQRGKGTDQCIEIRLDKAAVTHEWLVIFNHSTLTNIDYTCSDHTPIFLQPEMLSTAATFHCFRYENVWSREPLCSQLVEDCWSNLHGLPLSSKIAQCSIRLEEWGKENSGNFKNRIAQSKRRMTRMKSQSSSFLHTEFESEQNNYFELLAQQEIYWKQRSKQFWLHNGDKNTKYFHASASARKRNNQIRQLQNNAGEWTDWTTGLDQVIVQYFNDLYTAGYSSNDGVIREVNCTVSSIQNEELLKPVSCEEVRLALFQMHPDKAPGPDGMGPGFFQHHWNTVGIDVVNLVQDFFHSGSFPKELNETNLVLIPKKKNVATMGDLRPIALCNVAYKVISKVLANRMRDIIDLIISDTQSAFIPGRLISDNIMVAFEVMHYLKRKTKGKKGYMALKLDMSKAYDRVEWSYLQAVMLQMGFAERWVNLIMFCVSSVSYSVLHNGHRMGPILPSRGIRQGDPLSTYLFIICAEGFSALIKKFESQQLLQGCRVAHGAPSITHMLFADDSYLFCQATTGAAVGISNLLQVFENASGQKINFHKSTIFFSPNTSAETRTQICNRLVMPEASEGSLYLGLPNIVGRNKNAVLGFLKNKVIARVNSWDGKLLSRAGKEILLKTVVQSLPTYAMSVFLLTKSTCLEIEKEMARFWWKTSSSKGRGITWMSWDRMCASKSEGGLGFRNLHDFNLAMLAKQGWRLLCKPDSLAGKIYKARYYPHSDFLTAELGNNPSFVWRSIWSSQDLLRSGIRRTIGTGTNVNILQHPWLPNLANPYVSVHHPGLVNQFVDSLFITDSRTWDIDVVMDMFCASDAAAILGIPLSLNATRDSWSWMYENNEDFSVKSAYGLLQKQKQSQRINTDTSFWDKLWGLCIPPKVKNFLWRAATNNLPTCVNLVFRHVEVPTVCPVCKSQPETTSHALIFCNIALACWRKVGVTFVFDPGGHFRSWLQLMFTSATAEQIATIAMVCWSLWKARNNTVWKAKNTSVSNIVGSATIALDQWKKAQDKNSLSSLCINNKVDGVEHWTKPETNTIKLNVDASIFEREEQYGFGIVARDHGGNCLEARAGCFGGIYSAAVVEALGIKEALSWIKTKNWVHVVVETDSLVTVQAIRSSQIMGSTFGLIIQDCRSALLSLPNVNLCFVKRSANRAAHYVARQSRFHAGGSISDFPISSDLQNLMYSEC